MMFSRIVAVFNATWSYIHDFLWPDDRHLYEPAAVLKSSAGDDLEDEIAANGIFQKLLDFPKTWSTTISFGGEETMPEPPAAKEASNFYDWIWSDIQHLGELPTFLLGGEETTSEPPAAKEDVSMVCLYADNCVASFVEVLASIWDVLLGLAGELGDRVYENALLYFLLSFVTPLLMAWIKIGEMRKKRESRYERYMYTLRLADGLFHDYFFEESRKCGAVFRGQDEGERCQEAATENCGNCGVDEEGINGIQEGEGEGARRKWIECKNGGATASAAMWRCPRTGDRRTNGRCIGFEFPGRADHFRRRHFGEPYKRRRGNARLNNEPSSNYYEVKRDFCVKIIEWTVKQQQRQKQQHQQQRQRYLISMSDGDSAVINHDSDHENYANDSDDDDGWLSMFIRE